MAQARSGMVTVVAILNVIAWGGFWAFGYLALTAEPDAGTRRMVAALLALIGAAVGLWAYALLRRAARESGYERPYRRASFVEDDNDRDNGEQTT